MSEPIIPLTAWRYSQAEGSWVEQDTSSTAARRTSLRVATYNIWFGEQDRLKRYLAIGEMLGRLRPDVIALQEVIPYSLGVFKRLPWIRDDYWLSHVDQTVMDDYGVVFLSRLPILSITQVVLPSLMGRCLLVFETKINDHLWQFATVHLESLKESAPTREVQLERIFDYLRELERVVLVGDFNFDSSWREENDRLDPSYVDVWPMLHPAKSGYTEDTTINQMRYLMKGKHKHVRFDRVLFKNLRHDWSPTSIDLLGTEPVSPDDPLLFPSDHFGLVCDIESTVP